VLGGLAHVPHVQVKGLPKFELVTALLNAVLIWPQYTENSGGTAGFGEQEGQFFTSDPNSDIQRRDQWDFRV